MSGSGESVGYFQANSPGGEANVCGMELPVGLPFKPVIGNKVPESDGPVP